MIKRSQVHPHLIHQTNSDEPNNSYVSVEPTLRPKNLPLDNSFSDDKFCKWKTVQMENDESSTSNYISTRNNPYQNVVDESNELLDVDSMNSNFSKHCRNVSFNTAQKVHYYEAERTNKKSKAGLWLQLQDEDVSEVDTSSDSSSIYEDEYIVTDNMFHNREFPHSSITVSDVQCSSSDGEIFE